MQSLYQILNKITRIPQNFEFIMLEIGKKCDIIHDLSIFKLATNYCKSEQIENVQELYNQEDDIKDKHKINFINYITQSPDGKNTKLNQLQKSYEEQFEQKKEQIKHLVFPLAIFDKTQINKDEIQMIEKFVLANPENSKKLKIVEEQLTDNEKLLNTDVNKEAIHLKALYTAFYEISIYQIFKELNINEEDISYNVFYMNSQIPYFVNELGFCELTSKNIQRLLQTLSEKDQNQVLNLMNIENLQNINDNDFI